MITHCSICQSANTERSRFPNGADIYKVKCSVCGKYNITGSALPMDVTQFGKPYIFSSIIRNRSLAGDIVEIDTGSYKHLLESFNIPVDPFAKLDLLLKNTLLLAGRIDHFIPYQGNLDYPLIFAQDEAEFWYIANIALDLKLIERGPTGYRVTIQGWKRLDELKKTAIISDQVFVAMWFDKELDVAWENGIKKALQDCHYNAVRIDLQEHNEKICDRIILEIRKSALVVADFTGQRAGVYYETGFAMGLGIPVIRTCRNDFIDSLHFDTRQFSHVVWETPEELREKLTHRIQATYPRK